MRDLFGEVLPLGDVWREARLSDCGVYRWLLGRLWDPTRPVCGWVMLNPSTADGHTDDATIRRCMGFGRAWGFGGIRVANLFALRATDPLELARAADPVGPVNDLALLELPDLCDVIVAAWGTGGSLRGRDQQVIDLFRRRSLQLGCLGTTRHGHPRHPLYVAADTKLQPFEPD